MPDLTDQLLEKINSHQIPELDLPSGLTMPYYSGGSILNIPNSICRLLDAPPLSNSAPLLTEISDQLGDGVEKVLLILMDGTSLHRLQRWMAEEPQMVWNRLLPEGNLAPLTSIVPSTTDAALTTFWTAQPAARHGITGYEMWLKEYGVVANMILHKPMAFKGPADSLVQAGFDPQTFMDLPTMGNHLKAHGISTHVFQGYDIIHSGLSRMFYTDAEKHPIGSSADLWIDVRRLWQQSVGERLYTWVYWPEVDHASHFFGPDDEHPQAAFSQFSQAFEKFFLDQLSPAERKNTLVILTADHGHVHTQNPAPQYMLSDHRFLTDRLQMMPTGENRLAFLYLKPGEEAAVYEYVHNTWPDQFSLQGSEFLARKGLFGSGQLHPRLFERIGDLTAIALQDAFWWWSDKPNPLIGRHGGMHPHEMLVPFFSVRL